MAGPDSADAETKELRVGRRLKHPVYDAHGALLLAGGAVITSDIKAQLLQRGIEQVTMHPEDARQDPEVPAALSDEIAIALSPDGDVAARIEALAATVAFVVENIGPPLRDAVTAPGCEPYDVRRQAEVVQRFDATADLVQSIVSSVLDGVEQDAGQLEAAADAFADDLILDTDQVIAIGADHGYSTDIVRRSVRLATLAMAAGIRMGFDRPNVTDLGTCAIVQDWGMYCLAERLRDSREPYSAKDWQYFMKHPAYTIDALDQVQGLPDVVRVAAFQVHEQADGTGFPRGIRSDQIHPFARVINVLDEYLFLTCSVRGRPAIYPYDAIVHLLRQTSQGRFDREAARAVVELLSIFPIGSHVRLSDNSEAVVIRQNGGQHTKPIVQLLAPGDSNVLVDLTSSDLEISDALATPSRSEVRLPSHDNADSIRQGPGGE